LIGTLRNGIPSRSYGHWHWTYTLGRPTPADRAAAR
jgi:hypothetical protein